MLIIKKYSNRRLYDTSESRYITLEELASKIRGGQDIQVVDAKSGTELTQATLVQIIMESRGASRLLPVPLLTQMIRMGDDSLSEFLGQFMSMALQLYLQSKQRARSVSPYYPFASVPFAAADALARMMGGGAPWPGPWGRSAHPQGPGGEPGAPQGPPPWGPPGAWGHAPGQGAYHPGYPPQEGQEAPEGAPPQPSSAQEDIAALRKELEAIKKSLSVDTES
jgi:polyhydroxyalkanoate synthesis repressor PhaR